MVMRYALIDGGIVTNVVLGDDKYAELEPRAVALEANEAVSIGWTYADGAFTAPIPPPIDVAAYNANVDILRHERFIETTPFAYETATQTKARIEEIKIEIPYMT